MSIGVKTANGDVKIHSVHVVPADGYYTTRQIVENLEQYSDSQQNLVPAFTRYAPDGSYALYGRCTTSSSHKLCLAPSSFLNGYKNVESSIAFTASSTVVYTRAANNSGVYPISTANVSKFTISNTRDTYMRLFSEKISECHPAFLEKFPNCLNGNWFMHPTDSKTYKFSDLFAIANATSDDYIVTVNGYIYRISNATEPIAMHSGNNIVLTGESIKRFSISSSSLIDNKYYSDIQSLTTSTSVSSISVTPQSILNTTFDIYDTSEELVVEKNADITDFVKPTT